MKSSLDFVREKGVFLMSVPVKGDLVEDMKNLVGISEKDYPALWLLDLSTNDNIPIRKYKYTESEIRANLVQDFV